MKNTINFTDYLNTCLKREPSLKSTAQLKMGLTVSAFHANTNSRTGKKHTRTKTDEIYPPETATTMNSVMMETKFKFSDHDKDKDKKPRKKNNSEMQLKKTNSFKTLDQAHIKSYATIKNSNHLTLSKDNRQTQTALSIQKLRKQILNRTNPQLAHEELKQINNQYLHSHNNNDQSCRHNHSQSTTALSKNSGSIVANQYYLLSNDLLQTIKKMQHKHQAQLNQVKQGFHKREHKLMQKIIQVQKKNQRCSTLINQLRIRNIDVDGIWHQEKLNIKTNDMFQNKNA